MLGSITKNPPYYQNLSNRPSRYRPLARSDTSEPSKKDWRSNINLLSAPITRVALSSSPSLLLLYMASTTHSETLLTIPDNLSISQFMLDCQHPLRPQRGDTPCFTDNDSGQIVSFDEVSVVTVVSHFVIPLTVTQVKLRTQLLAAALTTRYNLCQFSV